MKIVAIIQARMSSRRLPGKILEDIVGSPLLAHVVRRAEAAKVFDAVIIATSTDATDDPVEKFCASQKITCFRGDLNDVLNRYVSAAAAFRADVIVRHTADCPLLDPAVIKKVVQSFDPNTLDYASNVMPRTYPKGLDTEVFSVAALKKVNELATLPADREHVTLYIRNHPDVFRIGSVTQERDLSALRWTVDEPADLEFVRAVYKELGDGMFGQREILDLLEQKPELSKINSHIPNP
ncbi:acylneuraminate cytidylyltransferase [Candidatus Peribacteria bacterium]|nr:acylneuraminate cytidylyltransferase [Candidatus Peribacteria bacterium]